MVRIDTVRQSVGLQPSHTSAPQLSNAVASATQQVGAAVSDAADTFLKIQQQKEDFVADNNYRKLQLDLDNELTTRSQNIVPGGDGFHDQFVSEVFRPKRDAFLATVPARLQPKFAAILNDENGVDAETWSIGAATVQRDEGYRWTKQEIGVTQDQLSGAIATNPEGYDAYLKQGTDLIEKSGLPTADKAALRDNWVKMAQVTNLNQLLQNDPQGVLRELGVDARQLSPTTQFSILSKAVQWQESRDNPNAVSGKGAVGLMQVMPGTARDIAVALGDDQFPTDAPDDVVRAYLSNPATNKRYGELYLRQQLKAFAGARDPIAAALVAYNAGPEVAKKWVESGYDDKVLSKETRDYKTQIMSSLTAPGAKGNPKDVQFVMRDGSEPKITSNDLKSRVATAYAALGLTTAKVNSGDRDPATNKRVGGASHSQHLEGDAVDLDVSGMKISDKVELIKALSASGVTGIGVYSNTIHADLAGRRAWGPSYGSESVPKWAAGVIAEHLQGTTPPVRSISSRYATMPYDTRQQFVSKADQLVTQEAAASVKSTAADRVSVKRAADNELALIRATGKGSTSFDETNISTILGEDDYVTYAAKKDVALRSYTATQGIATMDPGDMEQRAKDYEPAPGADDFAAQQQVQAAVHKEIERVTNLRAKTPDVAAMEYPEVKGAYAALQDTMAKGDPPPGDVQSFVKLMLATQADFGIKPEAAAPIPHDWALEIGKSLTRVPAPTGHNVADVRQSVIAQYNSLHQYFGDYTDEVITYALSEYKGLSKPTADLIGGYMKAIQSGGDPFRQRAADQALDQGQVAGFGISPLGAVPIVGPIFSAISGLSTLGQGGDQGLSPEEQLRKQQEASSSEAQ